VSSSRLAWGIPLVWAAVGAWSWACQGTADSDGGDESDTSDDGGRSREVLASVAANVIIPATASFAASASALEAATATHAEAVATDPGTATEATTAAQAAFRTAMSDWQALEVMQVGPLGPSANVTAGEDIRDEIYSWPVVNTCRIDQRIADGTFADASFFDDNLVNAYGMVALEYLLFSDAEAHTCPPQVGLDAGWDALGLEGIERNRAAYAAVLAAEISRHADVLQTRWSADGDDFAALLAGAGEGDSPYESDAEALDEVFHAMFYVDLTTKDTKLGRALGLADGCAAVPCPDLMEAPYSEVADEALLANLRALRLLVTGGPDPATATGFDDLLLDAGQPEIATTLLADIDAAIALVESVDAPMQDLVVSEPTRVQQIYDAIKRITDTLKGPFVMVLRLTVPSEGAGDAD
jgi:predicted lipoprotein